MCLPCISVKQLFNVMLQMQFKFLLMSKAQPYNSLIFNNLSLRKKRKDKNVSYINIEFVLYQRLALWKISDKC